MARSLGRRLPPALVERLSQRDLESRLGIALPLVTVDGEGRPHPMLLSYLEVRAYDSGTLGLVIQARSASARNLVERAAATLLIVEPEAVVYVKTLVVDGPLDVAGADALAYFLLAVEDVLEDTPADWEGGVHITGPVRYAPAPVLDEAWVRVMLAALATPRARA
jgi:Pyridoxamine 5'-phosphate oxidase